MVIYQIIHEYFEDGQIFFGTLAEAKAACMEVLENDPYDYVEVLKCSFAASKSGIVALANGRKWCVKSETVYRMGKPSNPLSFKRS